MPILGPSPLPTGDEIISTGSPYWLRVNGVWVQLEGVTPGVSVGSDRPRSEFQSLEGARFTQRASLSRRTWSLSIPHAASSAVTVALLRTAVESAADVMLVSDDQLEANMLPPRSCYGAVSPAIMCGGVPLLRLAAGASVAGYVRGGAPTTISCWTTAAAGTTVLSVARPGGTTMVTAVAGGRGMATFTPTADGPVTITAPVAGVTGLMMREESTLPETFIHGEGSGMPCKVEVQDPDDTLTMRHSDYWRHAYSVTLVEVG